MPCGDAAPRPGGSVGADAGEADAPDEKFIQEFLTPPHASDDEFLQELITLPRRDPPRPVPEDELEVARPASPPPRNDDKRP